MRDPMQRLTASNLLLWIVVVFLWTILVLDLFLFLLDLRHEEKYDDIDKRSPVLSVSYNPQK